MVLSRKRTILLVAFVGAVALSLRPDPRVERAVGYLAAPARVLGELGLPLAWMRSHEVRAAEERLGGELARERQACLELLAADQDGARPKRPDLLEGRSLIHAEVLERVPSQKDQVAIALPAGAAVEAGMPVVFGDDFVGRIAAVSPGSRRAVVELVTAASFRIGGRIAEDGASGRLVVGGLAPLPPALRRGALVLAAHNPSDRRAESGWIAVDERASGGLDALADGYRLGQLAPFESGGARILGVRAGLDFEAGLHQLVVLAPLVSIGASGERELRLEDDPFRDGLWTWVGVALPADPSFWRAGRKISAGSAQGIAKGAAVLFGARFAGRVIDTQACTADVGLLGDPGLAFAAIARIEGRAEPFALGRLTCLGRDGRGAALLRWEALVPLPADVARVESGATAEGSSGAADGARPVRAQLFTASGERGVPRGLFVGAVELPRGAGPHVLSVAEAADLGALVSLQVRLEPGGRP